MKRWIVFYGVLLSLTFAIGLASGTTVTDSPIPSANNPGPRGVKLLRAWLERTGHDVRVLDSAIVPVPEGVKTLVIVAPTGHAITHDERDGIEDFVRKGGTLVYFSPRRSELQHELDEWLQLSSAAAPTRPATDTSPDDVMGISDAVTLPGGALHGAKTLRFVADDALEAGGKAIPLTASKMLWWRQLGWGEMYLGAGADLAEGARLELDDNLVFWAGIAANGPVAFDEVHQQPKVTPGLSANLVAALLQLGFCAVAFFFVFGARLGPARPTPVEKHRSSLEYVQSMAALTRSAGVEAELAAELVERLKRLERLPPDVVLDPSSVHSESDYLAFSRRCAELEES